MNKNNIYNLIAKGLMATLIVVGVVLSYFVLSDGNPDALDTKGVQALGTEIAKAEGVQNKLTQSELIAYIEEKGEGKRQELSKVLHKDVSNVLQFTYLQLFLIIGTVVLGMVIGLIVNPKKFLVSLAIGGGFIIVLVAIYYNVSDSVPESLILKENQAVLDNTITEDKKLFIPSNWRLASWAIISSIILLFASIFVWIAGELTKVFK
jgi:hypothetical protein